MGGVSQDQVLNDERLDSLERRMDDVERWQKEAVPNNGDAVGHRTYHELMIEAARDRKRLIAAVKEKTIAGLVWGVLVALGATVWFGAIAYVKQIIGK